jgi:hypothetical protein
VNIQATFREHSGNIPEKIRERKENIQETYGLVRALRSTFREHSGNVE